MATLRNPGSTATAHRKTTSIRESLALYRQVFEHSSDGIAIIDPQGFYVEQNRAHHELTGYSDDDLAGQTPAIHLGQAGFQRIAQALQASGHFRGEVVSRTRSGDMRVLDLAAFTVYDERGEVLCYVGIKRDVSDRKRLEEDRDARMRELENLYTLAGALNRAFRLEEIYGAAIDAVITCLRADRASILIFDDEGVMRFRAWRNLSDGYRAAVEGHSPWQVGEKDPEPVTIADAATDPGLAPYRETILGEGIRALGFVPIVSEGRLLGKFMLYFDQPHRFTAEELRLAAAIASPVAVALERRRAEEVLRRSESLAAAGRLAATIAHEINNPLEAVTNLVYLLRASHPDADTADRYLREIEAELPRIAHLTKQTLGFYRDTERPSRTDLTQLVDTLLALYRPKLEARHILVEKSGGPVFVEAALGELRQVFSNLISNAIDAMENGGTLRIQVEARDGEARASFADTGHGIRPEHRARIFEPFFTTKRSYGTGLGLWVARDLIERYGGSIEVASSTGPEDHGTTFTVTLPAAPQS